MAMDIMIKLLSRTDSKTNIKVEGKLIVRESTAPPKF